MHFLIATAALLCAATLASGNPLNKISARAPLPKINCKIIGDHDVRVRKCASLECDETAVIYKPGQSVDFYCFTGGQEINNSHDKFINPWWDYSADGYFPDVYVEQACADKVAELCKVCVD